MVSKSAYGASAREIAELFADYLEGDADRPALVLSARPLDETARSALVKTLESFGYAAPNCTFATLTPRDPEIEGGDVTLDAQALFLLVEGLDPLFLVAADESATQALAQAFRTQLTPDAPARVLGRPTATFADLSANMTSEQGKQRAWRVLKTLKA